MDCLKCSGKMIEKKDKTPDGVEYNFFKCTKCGEGLLTMEQLDELAKDYREMKRFSAKLSKWGESIAVRIPKELVKKYKLKKNKEVTLVPEKNAIKIISLG
ncbi:MAG: AbrB/MazE/SpoVT family DNA-binding domain-containing protein [archaeon]